MGGPVNTIGEGGVVIPRSEADAALIGAPVQDPSVVERAGESQRQRKMFDNAGDKLVTFGEGLINAMSLGFMHQTGADADMRRDVNSTEAFAGEALGTAAGLLTGGPVAELAHLGEEGGKAAARLLLRQGEKSIASRALQEAGAGITLAGSSAMGHALLDTLVEDKPFATEAIYDAVKLGGMLGLGTGGLMGTFSKLASGVSRSSVEGGAGFAGTMADALDAHEVARSSYGEALHFHEAQLGAIKELRRVGGLSEVSDDFIRVRQDSVNAARRAQAALKDIDVEAALSGRDPAAYKELQRRWGEYHTAMEAVDGVMGIHPAERAGMAARELDTLDATSPVERTQPVTPDQYLTEQVTPDQFLTQPLGPSDIIESGGTQRGMMVDRTGQVTPDMMVDTAPQMRDFEGHMDTASAQRALDERMPMPDPTPVAPLEQTARIRKVTADVADAEVNRMLGIGQDRIGLPPGMTGETGPFEQLAPHARKVDTLGNTFRGETVVDRFAGAKARPDVTGPMERAPGDTGPFQHYQPFGESPTQAAIRADEAALDKAAGNVQGKRAKMFRDLRSARDARDLTQPGGPTDMTTEVTPDMMEQVHGSHEPTVQIPRPVEDGTQVAPTRSDLARQLLDHWESVSAERPFDAAKARTRSAMEGLYSKTNGRMTSSRALGLLEHEGIRPAADPVGGYMDGVYAMNRAAKLAGQEARGIATPLRSAMLKALGGKLTRAMLGNAIGGPVGALLGMTKFGGQLAASSGILAQAVVDSVNTFMSSTKSRALVAAAATNKAWEYSDRGPIKDPVERIQEVQFLASNPEGIRQRVLLKSGPLALVAPQLVEEMQNKAVQQVQALALRAPAIYYDKLGRALSPPQGKMRNYLEFENAMNDLGTILSAIRAGSVTQPQADALKTGFTSVHMKAAAAFFADPDALRNMSREKLRQVEMVTGAALTAASDPMFVVRQQTAWQPVAPAKPPAAAQAYSINPEGAPTPSQANASGRAPGN